MDEAAKKDLLRRVPYGLYVGCTRGEDGAHAFLLSWFTQTSFKPPLVACGVHRQSRAYKHLSQGDPGRMAINLLGADQQSFASAVLKGGLFEGDDADEVALKEAANGCALLPNCLGAIEVEVVEEAGSDGDHALFLCRVTEAHVFRDGAPLTHADTGWHYAG